MIVLALIVVALLMAAGVLSTSQLRRTAPRNAYGLVDKREFAIRLYHGTDLNGYKGIGLGNPKKNGLVEFPDFRIGPVKHGSNLGRGIYATSTLRKAMMYGQFVYLVKFRVAKIRVIGKFDQAWQSDDSLDAVYVRKNASAMDEFCFRDASKVAEIHVLQVPKKRLENPLVESVSRLSEALDAICAMVPHQDFVVYDMCSDGAFHCKFRTDGGDEKHYRGAGVPPSTPLL